MIFVLETVLLKIQFQNLEGMYQTQIRGRIRNK